MKVQVETGQPTHAAKSCLPAEAATLAAAAPTHERLAVDTRQVALQAALSAGAGEDAEDIAQTVTLAVLAAWRGGKHLTSAWVAQRAAHAARNQQRDDRTRQRYEQAWGAEYRARRQVPCWCHAHQDFGALWRETMATLLLVDAAAQDVIRHLYVYGYSVRDSLTRLHMHLSTMNSLRKRGVWELRRLLGVGTGEPAGDADGR